MVRVETTRPNRVTLGSGGTAELASSDVAASFPSKEWCVCMCVYLYVCVYEREREREEKEGDHFLRLTHQTQVILAV